MGFQTQASSSSGKEFQASFIFAYYLEVSGNSEAFVSKGGFRAHLDSSNKAAKIEVVVFFKAAEKEESVVMVFEGKEKSSKFFIKGSNGTYECSMDESGKQGRCIGTGQYESESFDWKAE